VNDVMGHAAGDLWHYLQIHGQSSVSQIIKNSQLDAKTLQRAIGWLAKEDKLTIVIKGRTELLALKEVN